MNLFADTPWAMRYAPLSHRWEIFTASGLRLGSVGAKAGTDQDKALSRLITAAPELLAFVRKYRDFSGTTDLLDEAKELLKRAGVAT